jgi:hypothetical protein
VPALLRRPLVAAAALMAIYVALSFLMDPGGYLGTDTGAKVATLDVMERRASWEPDVGYWAEEWDPEGDLHPIYDSRPIDDGWVHVTTLPMLLASKPLYAVGGYRLTLVLPMLGAVGAAFAARSIARRIGGEDSGWAAFYIIGLATPVAVYALDFWEHAAGVGCIAGAVALLAGVVDGEPVVGRALGAGALLGLSATLRNETLVYTLVAVGTCCVALLVTDRTFRRAVMTGVGAIAGFLVPWLANAALEAAVSGNSRGARATSTASSGLSDVGERLREGMITTFGLRPQSAGEALLLGGTVVVALIVAGFYAKRGETRIAVVAFALGAALHLARLADGLGFVPGMLAAAPLAAFALVPRRLSRVEAFVVVVASVSLPAVWAFQLIGGALPQWGGRYVLTSGVLLSTVAVPWLRRVGGWLHPAAVALSLLVTVTGIAWLGERSHEIEAYFDDLVERPEDVIVVRNGFFVREGGPAYSERLWLTAPKTGDPERAAEVVAAAGRRSFAVLDESSDAPRELGPAVLEGTDRTDVLGVNLYLHRYSIP